SPPADGASSSGPRATCTRSWPAPRSSPTTDPPASCPAASSAAPSPPPPEPDLPPGPFGVDSTSNRTQDRSALVTLEVTGAAQTEGGGVRSPEALGRWQRRGDGRGRPDAPRATPTHGRRGPRRAPMRT